MNNEIDKKLIRKCTLCGREYLKPQAICPKCDIVLMKLSDYEQLNMDANRANFQKEVTRQENLLQEQNKPKCPTCGSTNIRRISTAEKATGVILFGIFSNKRKYQFECQNPKCKYKW